MAQKHIPDTRAENEFTVRQSRDFNAPRIPKKVKVRIKVNKSTKGFK
jgi:hypothetical protein